MWDGFDDFGTGADIAGDQTEKASVSEEEKYDPEAEAQLRDKWKDTDGPW